MQNWNDQYQLTRLHREDLLREAANARLASEIDRPGRTWSPQRVLTPLLALIALLVGTNR